MKDNWQHIELLVERYPKLASCCDDIKKAYGILTECFANGNKLLVAGNGGSCADGEHIVGELMKGFKLPRKCSQEFTQKVKAIDEERGANIAAKLQGALPAIALSNHQALNTAFLNDVKDASSLVFAQQVYGYGNSGDVLLAISTSGNSDNIINATVVAKAKGLKVIGLTGEGGGKLANFADVCIKVPEWQTYMVQELHLPVYHCLCLMLEDRFFGID